MNRVQRTADHSQALLRAAAPALAAIEADAERAPGRLRPLFAAIAELLFEPDLDLDEIRQAAGASDEEVFADLRQAVGQPAWSYLRDARLETAARLLLATEISVAEIGRLVGYGSVSTFRGLLRSFLGMHATKYRRHAPGRLKQSGPAPEGAETDEYWERMLAGALADEEARALDADLERLAATSAPVASGLPGAAEEEDDPWARTRHTVAEGFIYTLGLLPFAEQRRLIRDAVWFPDGTLFEQLSRRSQEEASEGSDDPSEGTDRGVELALLAIDSLAANRMLETHPGRAALAWARLARARWLAGDLAAAEQDLEQSARDAARARVEDLDPSSEAERCQVTAAFYWHQGRWRQALALADQAVEAHRSVRSADLPQALTLRAELRAALADVETGAELRAALTDIEEARDLLSRSPRGIPPRGVPGPVVSLWLRILVQLGNSAEMAVALPEARRLASEPILPWFEGHCAADPEDWWIRARDGFSDLGDPLGSARATLDLTRFSLAQEHTKASSAHASQLASTLGALAASPEDLAAFKSLGQAMAPGGTLASSDLERVEDILARLEWNQRAARALELVR